MLQIIIAVMMNFFFISINRGLGSRERKPGFFRGKE
jgi:hypothetical protein